MLLNVLLWTLWIQMKNTAARFLASILIFFIYRPLLPYRREITFLFAIYLLGSSYFSWPSLLFSPLLWFNLHLLHVAYFWICRAAVGRMANVYQHWAKYIHQMELLILANFKFNCRITSYTLNMLLLHGILFIYLFCYFVIVYYNLCSIQQQ